MSSLRDIEALSIRNFVQGAAESGYLSGRVLDYGCGKQPYRDLVEAAGGEYHGYDRVQFGGNASGEDVGFIDVSNWLWDFNAILSTQVLQYVPYYPYYDGIESLLSHWSEALQPEGHLVMTYPTNWPEVEVEDLHRFTKAGMERLLTEAGFTIVKHELRAGVYLHYPMTKHLDEVALGYGVICRA